MRQSDFAAALLSGAAPAPEGLVDPQGRPAPARFGVYRNNVTASLLRVLQAAFPVVQKLVGPAFFQAMAVEFLRAHPPQTRLMMLYGADFPGFLDSFPPVATLPYLPDVARLEQSIRESYHSADAKPIAPQILTSLSEAAFLNAKLVLAPSLRLIRSRWPILSIWTVNREGGTLGHNAPEDLVILRAEFDPKPRPLSPGAASILTAILAGQPLGLAAQASTEEADLPALMTLLITQNALQDIT